MRIVDNLSNLYAHLLENHYIECITGFDPDVLGIFSSDVLKRIKENDVMWETMVPAPVADAIKRRGLFGHGESFGRSHVKIKWKARETLSLSM